MSRRRIAVLVAALAILALAAAIVLVTRPPEIEGIDELPPLRLREPRLPLPATPGRTSADVRSACLGDEAPRLLVVSIDNFPAARPQAGLDRACVVYELPVEGGATRFAAVYGAEEAPLIGPVRSVRKYTLEIAHELGAVLAHAGQSLEAFQLIRQTGWPVLNEFWTRGIFWRDRARPMPHNVYTDTTRLRAEMQRRNLDGPRPGLRPVLGETAPPEGAAARGVVIPFGAPYDVAFEYDPERGVYVRRQSGAVHRDARSGDAVTARTVIVQHIPATPMVFPWGEEGVRIDLVGEGRAVLLVGGQAIEGRWRKTDLDTPTRYLNALGRPVRLPVGRVWVVVVPTRIPIRPLP